MTNKELHRLSRSALIDLLIEQTERNNELEAKIAKLERQVKSRTITLNSPGSIADAAAELNKILAGHERVPDELFDAPLAAHSEPKPAQTEPRPRTRRSDWESSVGAMRVPSSVSAASEAAEELNQSSVVSRSSGRSTPMKKPESKAPAPRRDERLVRGQKRDPIVDPFAAAPLDDRLDKAFSEMLRHNAR